MYPFPGVKLTDAIVITPPAISWSPPLAGSGPRCLGFIDPVGGVVSSTPIYVVFSRSTAGTSTWQYHAQPHRRNAKDGGGQRDGDTVLHTHDSRIAHGRRQRHAQPERETFYASGTVVTLTATANTGVCLVTGWSGDLITTTNPIAITMDGNKSVTATFAAATLFDVSIS